jgi:hypothetical protein
MLCTQQGCVGTILGYTQEGKTRVRFDTSPEPATFILDEELLIESN